MPSNIPFPSDWQFKDLTTEQHISVIATEADKNNICVFLNKADLLGLEIDRIKSGYKNVVFIADELEIGRGNSVNLGSTDDSKSIGNLVIICRKLKITSASDLTFLGSSYYPQELHGINTDASYVYGLGSRFLIIAETISIDEDVRQKIILRAIKSYVKYVDNNLFPTNSSLIPSSRGNLAGILSSLSLLPDDQKYFSDSLSPKVPRRIAKHAAKKLMNIMFQKLSNEQVFGALYSHVCPGGFMNRQMLPFPFTCNNPLDVIMEFDPLSAFKIFNLPQGEDIQIKGLSFPYSNQLNPKQKQGFGFWSDPNYSSKRYNQLGSAFVGWSIGTSALSTMPNNLGQLYSKWETIWMKSLARKIEYADGNDIEALYKLLAEFENAPRNFNYDINNAEYDEAYSRIKSIKSKYAEYIFKDAINISRVGTCNYLRKGFNNVRYPLPTDIFISPLSYNNEIYYGLVQTKGDKVIFTINCELRVDPFVMSVTKNELNKHSIEMRSIEELGIGWEVSAPKILGADKQKVEIVANRVKVTIVVNGYDMNTFLLGLFTNGIPINISWKDSSKQSGFAGLYTIHLDKLSTHNLYVKDNKIFNSGSVPVVITYLQSGLSSDFVRLPEPIVIKPKEYSASLPAQFSNILIPSESVLYEEKSIADFQNRFARTGNGSGIVYVEIVNRIPAVLVNPEISDICQGISIHIDRLGANNEIVDSIGETILSPFPAFGSNTRLQFIIMGGGAPKIQISGKLILDKGYKNLDLIIQALPVINITEDNIAK